MFIRSPSALFALRNWVPPGKSCGPKRISNLLPPLRGTFNQAFGDDMIASSPFVGWSPLKIQPPRKTDDIDPFTGEEVAAILDSCDGQIRNHFQIAFWTDLYTSELDAPR